MIDVRFGHDGSQPGAVHSVRAINRIVLKGHEGRRIRAGHRWVFSNEIEHKDAESGTIVEVLDAAGRPLGHGFYNANSLVAVRLFAAAYAGDPESYLRTTIQRAAALRELLYPARTAYRLVFSESDFLPGLIIDRYNDTYVLQVNCFGMQRYIDTVVVCLRQDFGARVIFTRNDARFRQMEGLPADDTVYLGEPGIEVIDDGRIRYRVDFAHSQKTGFYFDQSENRAYIERFCAGRTVLDAYCHAGGFGLHAALANARQVTGVDSSAVALAQADANARENSLDGRCTFQCADVIDYLGTAAATFDIVMLDPPAFAKSRKHVPVALKGYEKLNRLALARIDDGGLLITSSCSHHVPLDAFLDAVSRAAIRTQCALQMVYCAGAAPDHPVLPAMPETAYLKFAVFRVCRSSDPSRSAPGVSTGAA